MVCIFAKYGWKCISWHEMIEYILFVCTKQTWWSKDNIVGKEIAEEEEEHE